jgi:hypothetical protein
LSIHLVTILLLSISLSFEQSHLKTLCEPLISSVPQQSSSPPQQPQDRPKPTIWEKTRKALSGIYSILWNNERYKGNLAQDANKNTEKGGNPGGNARLYLIDAEGRGRTEWITARGATEPTVSPDGKYLFYRRGNHIFQEVLKLETKAVVSVGDPKMLEGVEVKHLYACTFDRQRLPKLWVEDTQGKFRLVHFEMRKPLWANIPNGNGLRPDEIKSFMEEVQKMRSLRPDGFQATVRDYRLVGSKPNSDSLIPLDESSLRFFGNPAWVRSNSAFLFVNAISEE